MMMMKGLKGKIALFNKKKIESNMQENNITLPAISDGEDKSSPLKNRIRKNYRHIRKWAKRTATNCFRIYDRDIKEYPIVIDYYDGRFSVQYFTSSRDADEPPEELVAEV